MAKTGIKKNAQGYGYKYTDLAEIHNYLEAQGITYYQYIDVIDGVDYIMTVPIIDGVEQPPRRGCRVVEAKLSGKTNPAQEQGSAVTYCRRYSLLMAMGLCTQDSDAEELTRYIPKTINKAQAKSLLDLVKSKGMDEAWLFDRCQVTRLGEITEEQYAEVVKEMETV